MLLGVWKRFRSFCTSDYLLPTLFFLSQYKIWLGLQTFTADTGDGLAAFKFASYLPQYWNWYENAGQPYLFDIGAYRYSDPLMWPLLFLVKSLPVAILTQFNLFILAKITLIGIGCTQILKFMGLKTFERQLASLLILFGSFSAVQFRSIGMLDLLFCFVFFSFAFLAWIKLRKLYFLWLACLVLIHSTLSYHILYFVIIESLFLGLCFWCASDKKEIIDWLKSEWRAVIMMALIVSVALGAEYIVVKDPSLLPSLRNIRYNTEVDSFGIVITPGLSLGQSILNRESLSGKAGDCHSVLPCREYEYRLLDSLFSIKSYYSLTVFVSVFALFGLIWALFKYRSRRFVAALAFTIVNFIWSLGSHTPFWGLTQDLLPFLEFVRHTGFFVPVFSLGLIVSFIFAYSEFEKKILRREATLLFPGYLTLIGLSIPSSFLQRTDWRLFLAVSLAVTIFCLIKKWQRAVIFICIAFECVIFQRVVAESFKDFTTPKQISEIDRKMPDRMRERELRILNDFGVPRSSASTAYGVPSVLEPIHRPTMKQSELERRFNNIHLFGHFTPFMYKPYVEARLKYADNPTEFKKVFGVRPYSVAQIYEKSTDEAQFESVDLELRGEDLFLAGNNSGSKMIYLAIPYESISKIMVNEISTSFKKSRHFGIELSLPQGQFQLEAVSKKDVKWQFYILFYGAYFTLGSWVLLSVYRRRHVFEIDRYLRWHDGKTRFKFPRLRRV